MTLRDVEDLGDDISPEENEEIFSGDDSDDLDKKIDKVLNGEEIDYDFVSAMGAYDRLITIETCPERIKILKQLLQQFMEDNR